MNMNQSAYGGPKIRQHWTEADINTEITKIRDENRKSDGTDGITPVEAHMILLDKYMKETSPIVDTDAQEGGDGTTPVPTFGESVLPTSTVSSTASTLGSAIPKGLGSGLGSSLGKVGSSTLSTFKSLGSSAASGLGRVGSYASSAARTATTGIGSLGAKVATMGKGLTALAAANPIAAGIIAGIIVVGLIGGAVYYYRRKYRVSEDELKKEENMRFVSYFVSMIIEAPKVITEYKRGNESETSNPVNFLISIIRKYIMTEGKPLFMLQSGASENGGNVIVEKLTQPYQRLALLKLIDILAMQTGLEGYDIGDGKRVNRNAILAILDSVKPALYAKAFTTILAEAHEQQASKRKCQNIYEKYMFPYKFQRAWLSDIKETRGKINNPDTLSEVDKLFNLADRLTNWQQNKAGKLVFKKTDDGTDYAYSCTPQVSKHGSINARGTLPPEGLQEIAKKFTDTLDKNPDGTLSNEQLALVYNGDNFRASMIYQHLLLTYIERIIASTSNTGNSNETLEKIVNKYLADAGSVVINSTPNQMAGALNRNVKKVPKKTQEKVSFNGKDRVVYEGIRGGKYVKMNGEFVRVKH